MTVVHEGDKTPTDVTITRSVIQVHSVPGCEAWNGGELGIS